MQQTTCLVCTIFPVALSRGPFWFCAMRCASAPTDSSNLRPCAYKSAVGHTPCHCSSEPSWLYFLIGKALDQGPDLRDYTELTLTHRSPFQLTAPPCDPVRLCTYAFSARGVRSTCTSTSCAHSSPTLPRYYPDRLLLRSSAVPGSGSFSVF